MGFNASVTGFIIGMLLFSLMITTMMSVTSEISLQYGIDDNTSFASYENRAELMSQLQTIEDSTKIQQQEGVLDVIGGFFSSGYSALRTTFLSFSVFDDLVNTAQQDLAPVSPVFVYFRAIIVALLIVGLAMAALLKVGT